MTLSLAITLGHNSSAVAIEDGHIMIGYEEERFTTKKSDSSFPINSIEQIKSHFGVSKFDNLSIGHWFTAGELVPSKYADFEYLNNLVPNQSCINSLMDGFTHHDSHLLSAEVFAQYYDFPSDHLAIVADGFGTFGECVTLYHVNCTERKILHRFFGFEKSLGLLYQYATAYLEMKMHNHEYKLLGYEAHIDKAISREQKANLNLEIQTHASVWLKNMFDNPISKTFDPLVNVAALSAVQHEFNKIFDDVIEKVVPGVQDLVRRRIVIAYFVQGLVESVMKALVDLYAPKALLVSGGLFYNVKLNSLLADKVDKFCVMPLAGDQGAGLGVYEHYFGDLKWPGHLEWGFRNLKFETKDEGIVFTDDIEHMLDLVADELQTTGFVNLVRGAMEFGPRSLCNTATLAMPTEKSVDMINLMNDRTTIMPMAPVMTSEQIGSMLLDSEKIVGSLEYMIVTRDVKPGRDNDLLGASHYYSDSGRRTCRPQQISKMDPLECLVEEFGPLINTSFNFHGVPIVFDGKSIEYSHKKQNETSRIKTVVLY